MKIAIVTFISCLMTSVTIAGTKNTNPPAAVLESFSSQYPGCISPIKWICVNDTSVAKFRADQKIHVAFYLSDGSWIKTITRLRWTWNLPACVKYSFKQSRFAPWSIDDVNFIESTGKSYYTISVFCELGPEGSIPGDIVDRYVLYFYSDGTNFKTDHIG